MSHAEAHYPEQGKAFLAARSQQFVPLYHDFLALAGDCNKAAYLGLAFFWQRGAGHREWVAKSSGDFAEVLPLSKTTQDRCRKWLKEKGLLETRRTNELPTCCQWRLNVEMLASLVLDLKRPVTPNWGYLGDTKLGLPSYTKKKKEVLHTEVTSNAVLFEGCEESPKGKPKTKKKTKRKTKAKKPNLSKRLTLEESQDFQRWYAIYPRHSNIGAARGAWREARAHFPPGEQGLRLLLTSTADWVKTKRAEPDFDPKWWPWPASWLRNERWADDLSPVEEDPNEAMRKAAERTRKRYGS